MEMEKEEFNGYSFDNPKIRKKMKYIVVTRGNLDLNGAYAFKSKRELKKYMLECRSWKEPEAVFEIHDISKELGL